MKCTSCTTSATVGVMYLDKHNKWQSVKVCTKCMREISRKYSHHIIYEDIPSEDNRVSTIVERRL